MCLQVGKEDKDGNKEKTRLWESLVFKQHFSPSHHRPFAGLAKDGYLEVLIENLAWIFRFRPTDENLHFEARFQMNNFP